MALSKVEIALYGLLQTVGQTTENEYVEYLHKDGTKHRLLWQDVVRLVEGAVAKINQQDTFHQLTRAVLQHRPWHGSNYNEFSFVDPQLDPTVADHVRRQEAALQYLRPLYDRTEHPEIHTIISILEGEGMDTDSQLIEDPDSEEDDY